jgi:hypothetical protein
LQVSVFSQVLFLIGKAFNFAVGHRDLAGVMLTGQTIALLTL